MRTVRSAVKERLFYPASDGRPIRRDPTYGRVSRKNQWIVQRYFDILGVKPSPAQRVVVENKLQKDNP